MGIFKPGLGSQKQGHFFFFCYVSHAGHVSCSSLFVLTPHFNLFSDSVSDTDTTGFVKSLTFNQTFISRSSVYCRLADAGSAHYSRAVLHLSASSAILNRPPQKSLQETLPPPPTLPYKKTPHWLLYFRPKLNVKSASSLSLPGFSQASAHLSQFCLQPPDRGAVQPCVPFRKLPSASPDVI